MAAFSAKRQLDTQSTAKELKRLSAYQTAKAATYPAAVATANATDLATCQALANQLKTTLNALLAALQ
jgi:hypothetical protein